LVRKFLLRTLFLYELFFALFWFTTIVDRREVAQAVVSWEHDPNPQTVAELRHQQHLREMTRLRDSATDAIPFTLAISALITGGIQLVQKVKRKRVA